MIPGWRRRKSGHPTENQHMEIMIPKHFQCPISLDQMKDPVILSSGITYDRENIEKWLQAGNITCPVTNQVLTNFDPIPNHSIRKMIQDWCIANKEYGVERIPTPKIPITTEEVSEILCSLQTSSLILDKDKFLESLEKIKKWGLESERNRRCMIDNGTAGVLGAAFEIFANDSYDRNVTLLEEILSVLNWMFPLGPESNKCLGSPASLRCMVCFLDSSNVSVKSNASLVLNDLSSDQQVARTLGDIEGVHENLFMLIKNPIDPKITKASLRVTYNLLSLSSCKEVAGSKFVEMGLVSLLLEILVEADRSLCEKALGVFDQLCCSEEGREKAYKNDLTMSVLVKKMLRVSELATSFSVSAILRLCKNENNGEVKDIIEALQLGAFQKLLLLLQVGCGSRTKEKATELLKLLDPYRPDYECIDSADFKHLRRSF